MQKKVVFIFSTAYLPFVGGAEVATKEITDRISEYDFILFTAKIKRGLPNKEKIGNILVYRLGFGFSFDKFLLPLFAFIKFSTLYPKPYTLNSVLWGMMASYGGIAAYFIKLFKPKIPFLLTLQEGDSETHLKYGKFGFVGFFGKRIMRCADYIQTISNHLKDFARIQGARSPVAVVPNGVSLEESQKSKVKSQKLKEELNIKPVEKIVITISRLVYKNGVDVLIKSIKELKKIDDTIKIKLLILGEGVLRKELENLTLKLNLKNEVMFLGFITQEQVYDYLAISDVFCRPSRSEGLGNSFLEAMSAGVPIIGVKVGGIPDFLTNNETGLFCEVNNPRDLAEKIKLFLEDDELRAKIIANAKKLVVENYNWDGISLKMKEIFNNLTVY